MTGKLLNGLPYPLGSYFDGKGVNFAIFSANAEQVDLCLFSATGEEQRIKLPCRSGHIWHGYLKGGKAKQLYGYRVYGAWQPEQGHRFNPNKLLMDPYTKSLVGKVIDSPRFYDVGISADEQDSAIDMPKCQVIDEKYNWQNDRSPSIAWANTIIYEAHVHGISRNHPDIPDKIKGSYAALAHPALISHFKKLGITTLELMPVQYHVDEPRLQQLGLSNYWGYNVLAPFAVEPGYWSGRKGSTPLSEFRDMVKALHNAGIEIILDVVFNHSAELDKQGPTFSFKGIDNASYYWLDDQSDDYLNYSGCGNTLRLDQPATIQWVLDCLRYWIIECHVDGFRFDLGTILGRTPDYTPYASLFLAMQQDPVILRSKLIFEPWDIGAGGYQLGQFISPFAEWNNRFRDDIRAFWLHKQQPLSVLAKRFAASGDFFNHHGRKPSATINLLTTHDGFTLQDLVSFNDKHNQANGENNRDGHNQNWSCNFGTEGIDADKATQQLRKRHKKALLTLLLLSQGTPMLLAGDEWGHSQHGNNNSYCQNNKSSWLDWKTADADLIEYVAQLIALRKKIPVLNNDQWWSGEKHTTSNNPIDVVWLTKQGTPFNSVVWQQQLESVLLIQLAEEYIIVINPTPESQLINLPQRKWQLAPPFLPHDCWCEGTNWLIASQTIVVLIHSSL